MKRITGEKKVETRKINPNSLVRLDLAQESQYTEETKSFSSVYLGKKNSGVDSSHMTLDSF